jgi:hypothetical protein
LLFVEGFIPLWFNSLDPTVTLDRFAYPALDKIIPVRKNRGDGGIPVSRFYGSHPQMTMTALNFHRDLQGLRSVPACRIEVGRGEKTPILVSMIPLTPQNL